MSQDDPERVLPQLAEIEEEWRDLPSDETLRALRAGQLPDEEALEVIRALALSPEARERLAELAGVPLPRPGSSVRRELFDRLADEEPVRPGRRRSGAGWRWGLAAAACLGAALAWPLWKGLVAPNPAPANPPVVAATAAWHAPIFAWRFAGSRQVRGSETGAGNSQRPVAATPGTSIAVDLEPPAEADPEVLKEVHFGLYRARPDGALERVDVPFGWTAQGTVHLEALARNLTPEIPARLFVIVAGPRDPLAAEVRPPAGQSPQEFLAAGGRRQVIPLILDPPS